MKFIKSIPISGKFFLATIIICLTLLIIYFLPLPKDYEGRPCGVKIDRYAELIFLYGMLLTASVAIIELVVSFIRKTPKTCILIVLILSLFLLWNSIVIWLSAGRTKAYIARVMAEMNLIKKVQDTFYQNKGRYADTQEELVEAGLIYEKLKSPITHEEYTDEDGNGLEGGDDNPNTWEITTFIPTREFDRWCKRVKEGYWYTCNQESCQNE